MTTLIMLMALWFVSGAILFYFSGARPIMDALVAATAVAMFILSLPVLAVAVLITEMFRDRKTNH